MEIGKPQRTYTVEPIEDPLPRESPTSPPEDPGEGEAPREPEEVPAR